MLWLCAVAKEEWSLYSGEAHRGQCWQMGEHQMEEEDWLCCQTVWGDGQGHIPASVADSLHCLALFWL